MAEGGAPAEDQAKFGIVTEPVKTLVYNAPFQMRQKANLRLTNNSMKTFFWQVKSTKNKCFVPTPSRGVMKPNEQLVMLVNCEVMPKPPENDRLTIEYVEAPEGAGEKCDPAAFEAASSINRRVIQIVANE